MPREICAYCVLCTKILNGLLCLSRFLFRRVRRSTASAAEVKKHMKKLKKKYFKKFFFSKFD